MHVRKRVSTLAAAPDIEALGRGVALMKERSRVDAMDPLGWVYQSRMHGHPEGRPRSDGEPTDWSECQHGSWFFLPWHRMYLLQFERIIGALTETPDFALPYWDYPDTGSLVIPPAFLDPQGGLFDDTRTLRAIPPTRETWRDQSTFVAFAGGRRTDPIHRGEVPGAIELNPHNPVHGNVGGDMAQFQSPLDALFWIHHCNIDRLWEVWLAQPGRANPDEESWTETTFEFPDPDPPGRKTWKVAEVATSGAAGYEYDTVPAKKHADALRPMVEAMPDRPRRDDALELLGASEGAGSVNDTVELQPERRPARDRSFAVREDEIATPPALFLRLENLGVTEGDASDMWNIYVRAGAAGKRHHVATIAPFGLAGLTASGGRQEFTVDISYLSEELLDPEAGPIKVSFEKAHEDVVGEPFWDRMGLYTTSE